MSLLDSVTTFAASYNCGSYGADSFNSAAVCGTSTTTTSLASTGIDVLIPAGIAVIAIIASFVMLLKRRSARS